MAIKHSNSPADATNDSSTEPSNGDVGLRREPDSMPSHDDRVATVTIGDSRLIVGYRWAVYGHISLDGKLTTFKGWKSFSTDTRSAITALEAAAAETFHGAPAIELPEAGEPIGDLALDDELIHVRTKNSELPKLIPAEHLVFEVNHKKQPD